MRQQRDGMERRSERARAARLDHDDELAARIAAMDLTARQREDCGLDQSKLVGTRLHQDAGDLCAGWRHEEIARERAACDESAAIDGSFAHDALPSSSVGRGWPRGPG